MRYLLIFFLLSFLSCKEEKRKAIQNTDFKSQKVIMKNQQKHFYNNTKIKIFDINHLPFPNMSLSETDKYKVSESLKSMVLKKENYYKLINYNEISKTKNYTSFTIYGSYDYYTNILLITSKSDSLIDSKIIASILGDGDYMTEISTVFLDSISFKITTLEKHLLGADGSTETLSSNVEHFKINPNGKIILNKTK